MTLSNTHLLETRFGWTGILAEPARCWHERLRKNRAAHIESNCVWTETGAKLRFSEVDYAELSTVSSFVASDLHHRRRRDAKDYEVSTISLCDLLDKYRAPSVIDYLSIDTEGSEFDILNSLDFDRWSFRVITCEHNHTPRRADILALLTKNGYRRVFEQCSEFDDWYVRLEES